MYSLSPTAKSILTLLNNINDLIVQSSDRNKAKDVMSALKTYAMEKKFDIDESKIRNFYSVLLDARPITLTTIIKDIALAVARTDKEKSKKS